MAGDVKVIKIRLGGILELSTVDWPGRPAAVLFLAGCNFRCPFCFNADLVAGDKSQEVEVGQLVQKLEGFRRFLGSVVITGGEPTLQDITPLCEQLKAAGFAIKLDTNGSRPGVVTALIAKGLVDFVALDIKGPLDSDDYSRVTGLNDRNDIVNNVRETLKILNESGIDYECRSPIVPTVNADYGMLKRHAESVRDAKVFVLEQFWPEKGTLDSGLKNVKGLSRDQMLAAANLFENPVVKIRTREAGEETVKA